MAETSTLIPLTSLSPIYQRLCNEAITTQGNGYAPYSHFLVGAALLHKDKDHTITAGCNCEVCTHNSCCAERCAIVSANAKAFRTAWACAVFGGPSPSGTQPPLPADALITPCGNCRQLLHEVAQLSQTDLTILMVTANKENVCVKKLSELLPIGFGPTDCGVDISKWAAATNETDEMPQILS